MDPLGAPIPNLAAVVQAVLLRQGLPPAEVEALLQLVGQELSVLFLGQGTEGARLELPNGKVVTAQGELPFPEGTHLRVRVEAEAGGLKFQTLEARPPSRPALLAPLLQGEAATLMARLSQGGPVPDLAPLLQLLQRLGGLSDAPTPVALPSPGVLAQAILALPKELIVSLSQVLGIPEASPEILAARLITRLEGDLPGSEATVKPARNPAVEARTQLAASAEVQIRFQGLLQQREIPADHASALDGWIRGLLARKTSEGERLAPTQPEPPRGAVVKTPAESRMLSKVELVRIEGAISAHPGPALEVPEAWEGWIKGTVRALTEPAVSPREAPFHALQGKEGTAFFELPLPWAGGGTLQLWVEEDAPDHQQPKGDEIRRVLLSLELSHLGETRVGLQRAGNGLAVRIWTEHPEPLEKAQGQIEHDLGASGKVVDLRIYRLNPSGEGRIPDLRSLLVDSSLHALG